MPRVRIRTEGKRGRTAVVESAAPAPTAVTEARDRYTPEYWQALNEQAYVENILARYDESELSEGDRRTLKNARDRVAAEREISDIAREHGYTPGQMTPQDWNRLSDELTDQAVDELRYAARTDREAAGEKLRGQADIWAQVGGEARLVRSGARKKEAQELVARLNKETQAAADDYMGQKLVEYGYNRQQVEALSYTQKRRAIAEIGAGEPQKAKIGGLDRDDRERIVSQATSRQQQAAYSIALNPRAANGLDTWTYGLQAAEKAGNWNVATPPDYVLEQDQAPGYVKPARTAPAEDILDF